MNINCSFKQKKEKEKEKQTEKKTNNKCSRGKSLDNRLDDLIGMFSKTTSNYKFYIYILVQQVCISVTLDTFDVKWKSPFTTVSVLNIYCKPVDQFKASKFDSLSQVDLSCP